MRLFFTVSYLELIQRSVRVLRVPEYPKPHITEEVP